MCNKYKRLDSLRVFIRLKFDYFSNLICKIIVLIQMAEIQKQSLLALKNYLLINTLYVSIKFYLSKLHFSGCVLSANCKREVHKKKERFTKNKRFTKEKKIKMIESVSSGNSERLFQALATNLAALSINCLQKHKCGL